MKQLTAIFLIAALLCGSMVLSAHATEEDIPLRDVLINKNQEMVEEYIDPTLFDETMDSIVWNNQPYIFFFTRHLYNCTEMSLDELLADSFYNRASEVVILNDTPIGIARYKYDTKIGAFDFPVYTYLQDILDGKATQEFLGEVCTVINVHCFGINTSWDEKDVLYITDKGLYVRCYANGSAEAVEFDWDSYCVIAKAYSDYITSPELNFNENGELLAGCSTSFLEFAENPTKYVPDYGKEPESPWLVWCLAGVGVVAVAAAATAVFLIRRKRKQATEQ